MTDPAMVEAIQYVQQTLVHELRRERASALWHSVGTVVGVAGW